METSRSSSGKHGKTPVLARLAFCLYLPDCRVLGARIRDQERKMITMGTEIGHVSHDITPIHKVLPEQLLSLACIALTLRLMPRTCPQIWREWKGRNCSALLQVMASTLMTRLMSRWTFIFLHFLLQYHGYLGAIINLLHPQMDLVKKLERARLKGSGLMMITDEVEKKKTRKKGKKSKYVESDSESDSDFDPDVD